MALLGAAAAASAQSSVTLFGVVDATLAFGRGSVAHRTQMLRGGYNSNRLGFRGVEDLGGGLSAQFWLETGFNVDDGSGQATNTNNQASSSAPAPSGGLTFNRRSTVSIAVANTRASNQISYFTPNTLGGFFVHAAHYLGENASGAATSKKRQGQCFARGLYEGATHRRRHLEPHLVLDG